MADDFLFQEEQLARRMREEALPYLQSASVVGRIKSGKLYYELFSLENPRGTVVISHGFAEAGVKYYEFIYYLLKHGYQAAVMDHRGHGYSVREIRNPDIAYVDRFDRYAEDLHEFVQNTVRHRLQKPGLPLYLYGHSMGGCIAARYLEKYPGDFDKAVLNAPMLGLKLGLCPSWAALLLCEANVILGRGQERLFYQNEFDPEEPFAKSSASSMARHDYYQEQRRRNPPLRVSSASYRWGREAIRAGFRAVSRRETARVRTPVLLFQAGEDTLVTPAAQRLFVRRIRRGRLVVVPCARHEIYRASNRVLERYLKLLFRFLDRPL